MTLLVMPTPAIGGTSLERAESRAAVTPVPESALRAMAVAGTSDFYVVLLGIDLAARC